MAEGGGAEFLTKKGVRHGMRISTLCYLEKEGQYLMLLRNKKEHDVNEGKWIGVGGKLEGAESPEECVCREVREETGLELRSYKLRGILTFSSVGWEDELIFIYTADSFDGRMKDCDEGELKWIDKDKIMELRLWEGDRIFLDLLMKGSPLFSMKLSYEGDVLVQKTLQVYTVSVPPDIQYP